MYDHFGSNWLAHRHPSVCPSVRSFVRSVHPSIHLVNRFETQECLFFHIDLQGFKPGELVLVAHACTRGASSTLKVRPPLSRVFDKAHLPRDSGFMAMMTKLPATTTSHPPAKRVVRSCTNSSMGRGWGWMDGLKSNKSNLGTTYRAHDEPTATYRTKREVHANLWVYLHIYLHRKNGGNFIPHRRRDLTRWSYFSKREPWNAYNAIVYVSVLSATGQGRSLCKQLLSAIQVWGKLSSSVRECTKNVFGT